MKSFSFLVIVLFSINGFSHSESNTKERVYNKISQLFTKINADINNELNYNELEKSLDQLLGLKRLMLSCQKNYDNKYYLINGDERVGIGIGISEDDCLKLVEKGNHDFVCSKSAFEGYQLLSIKHDKSLGVNLDLNVCLSIVEKSTNGKTCYASAFDSSKFYLYESSNDTYISSDLSMNSCIRML
jgi:hypothetical protein